MRNDSASDELLLGSHQSSAGGMWRAIERGESIDCTAIQLFVKMNSRWAFPALSAEDAEKFREKRKTSCVRSCIAHAIYLVNLASTNPEFLRKSMEDLVDELQRCDALDIPGLVMHPGAHCGNGLENGIDQIAAGLNAVFEASAGGKAKILLETTAGQGSCVGDRFEHLRIIMDKVSQKNRMGVCLDTCHVFAAGWDIRTPEGYKSMWQEFDGVIGREHLYAIHLNDSKKPLGSKVDRHEHIGKGHLGLKPFEFILNDSGLRGIPMVIETEKEKDLKEDVENLRVLKSLVYA